MADQPEYPHLLYRYRYSRIARILEVIAVSRTVLLLPITGLTIYCAINRYPHGSGSADFFLSGDIVYAHYLLTISALGLLLPYCIALFLLRKRLRALCAMERTCRYSASTSTGSYRWLIIETVTFGIFHLHNWIEMLYLLMGNSGGIDERERNRGVLVIISFVLSGFGFCQAWESYKEAKKLRAEVSPVPNGTTQSDSAAEAQTVAAADQQAVSIADDHVPLYTQDEPPPYDKVILDSPPSYESVTKGDMDILA